MVDTLSVTPLVSVFVNGRDSCGIAARSNFEDAISIGIGITREVVDEVIEVPCVDGVIVSSVSEDRNSSAVGDQSLESSEVSSLEAVLQVVNRVVQVSVSIVVIASGIVDIHKSDVPSPVSTIVAYVDVVAGEIARKERVSIPWRNNYVEGYKWGCAVVWIPEVVIAPEWIVVAIAGPPAIVRQSSILPREVLAKGLEFHRVWIDISVVRRRSIAWAVLDFDVDIVVGVVIDASTSRRLIRRSAYVAGTSSGVSSSESVIAAPTPALRVAATISGRTAIANWSAISSWVTGS